MAETDVSTGAPASINEQAEPRSFAPREYLEFLTQLERVGWRLPGDTRAYLVTLQPSGERQVQPVRFECSVLNLDKELPTHLKDAMVSNETLSQVREICNQRLKERGKTGLVDVDPELVRIGHAATHEIQTLAALLRREVEDRDATGEVSAIARGMLLRIELLSDIAFDAITDDSSDAADVEDLSRKLGE